MGPLCVPAHLACSFFVLESVTWRERQQSIRLDDGDYVCTYSTDKQHDLKAF